MLLTGNRCGHNPKKPHLSAAETIRKGRFGLPRILSLAAERAKAWYLYPDSCTPLCTGTRRTRSERREAIQIVIEAVLRHLDLASLCVGVPTLNEGFIDMDMRTIVKTAGIGQRRCERAIAVLKEAGFMKVAQPRKINAHGDYVGCRAIRLVTTAFFDWLGLEPMLQRERARASEALRRKALKANRKVKDMMSRLYNGVKKIGKHLSADNKRRWNNLWSSFMAKGFESSDAQREVNEILGYPPGFSPGQRLKI